MFRAPQVCLLLSAAALILSVAALSGCARQTDTFRPHIIITQPEAGSISRQKSSVVRGYAMDDSGIAAIRVQGQALKLKPGSRKIVPFAFKTSTSGSTANYTIEATDKAGLSTKVELPLRFDARPPELEITKFERDAGTLRVTGVATDDVKVSSIVVDGSKLGVATGQRVPFYAESSGVYVDIAVTDAAGNVTKKRVQ